MPKSFSGDSFRIKQNMKVRLADFPTAFTGDGDTKLDEKSLIERLEKSREKLSSIQELLYADNSRSVLLIFQAMDAAGKDGAIRHVMSGVNPQGCQVFSFKKPSAEELDHNFLWRYSKALPELGRIGIFNRSYYEDVLVVKVHPELLNVAQVGKPTRKFWEKRYEDINSFEKHLHRNGTLILKFFLHISAEEQKQRFLDRLNDQGKYWKFACADLRERAFWEDYQKAYSDAISATSTKQSPWHVIPGDNKHAARASVAEIIVSAIAGLDLQYPEISPAQLEEIEKAKAELGAPTID